MRKELERIIEKYDLKRPDRKGDIVPQRVYFCYHLYQQGYRYDFIGELLGKDRGTARHSVTQAKNRLGNDFKLYIFAHRIIKELNDIEDVGVELRSPEWVIKKAVDMIPESKDRRIILAILEPLKEYMNNNVDSSEIDKEMKSIIKAVFEINVFASTADLIEEVEKVKSKIK